LALDMMEPFRPLVADSAVLLAINNGVVRAGDVLSRAGAVALTPTGRRAIIGTFERRLDQEITHPLFGYRVAYRCLFEVRARLLERLLAGEIPDMPHITP
jgi:CRISPR-associated protein Cas1